MIQFLIVQIISFYYVLFQIFKIKKLKSSDTYLKSGFG